MILPDSLYRAAFESSADALLLLGDGRVASANKAARRLFGDGAALDGRELTSLFPSSQPDGRPSAALLEARIKAAVGGAPQRFSWTCQHHTGSSFPAEIMLTSLGEAGSAPELLVTVRAIGSRTEVAPDFHLGEEELRAILEGAPLAVSVVGPDSRVLFTSRVPTAVIPTSVAGKGALTVAAPAFHAALQRTLESVIATGQRTSVEIPIVDPSGELVWHEIHAGAFRRRGAIEAVVTITVNIDARKRAERARAESEERLRSLFESLPSIIMTLDKERRLTGINRWDPRYTLEQLLGASAFDFIPPAFHETARAAFDSVFATGLPTSYETVTVLGTESAPVWFAVHISPIRRDGEVVALMLATEDITERKRLEQELRGSLARAEGTAAELEEKNRLLAEENAERSRTEDALRREREVVLRLSTPIIKAWDGVLALPIIGALDSERAAQMMERLLAEIAATRARFAVIDLTGATAVDTATVGYLVNIVRAAGLLGSRCLVSGISPSMAQAMIGLGAGASGFRTFGQMQDALRHALFESGVR